MIITVLTHIIAVLIGASAGYWWCRTGEQKRLREVGISAYNRGIASGLEKAVKEIDRWRKDV